MIWHRSTVIALVSTAVLFVAGCSKNAEPPAPPINQVAADLPLLPMAVVNAPRPVAVVKAAYEFAARHPEVLSFVPCFCGCEAAGHSGNHDCFVAGRDGEGHVTNWDAHGIGCTICIDVATEAKQLHESGASVEAIRAAIDRRYANMPSSTPTPMPGGHGGH